MSSLWTSGYGRGRSAAKTAPIKVLEDNDVFFSDEDFKGAVKPNVRGLALSDSSNNLPRNTLSGNEFEFKKPIVPVKAKVEKSSSVDSQSSIESTKQRSHSVPAWFENSETVMSLKQTSTADLNELLQQDNNLYPEPELSRKMANEDLEDFSDSPIQRAGGIPEFFNDDLFPEFEPVMNLRDEHEVEEDDLSDESYPEIEHFPNGYSTRIYQEDLSNDNVVSPNREITQRSDTEDAEISAFLFKLDSSFLYIGKGEEYEFSPSKQDVDIEPPPLCFSGSESDDDEPPFVR